jgi:hypothetical protein
LFQPRHFEEFSEEFDDDSVMIFGGHVLLATTSANGGRFWQLR